MASEIAIVGMACRFPHAADVAQFWSRLCEGHDAIEEIPASRFNVEDFYDPRPGTPGKIVSRQGGFLDGIDQFDSGFFGIAPREADRMDPQQRLLMEVAQAAIEDAGHTRDGLAGSRSGVFMGTNASNYWEILSRSGVLDTHAKSGTTPSILSGRLSYFFDLHGPSLTVDTACSSSLSAVHLACQSLRSGESSLALAGGTNIILAPEDSITFSSGKMLSPDGRCKFASADANGFVRSEGVGVVVLKRLRDAVADGDAIRAVILGSATVNDGQAAVGMMAPSRTAQEQVLRAACSDAGVRPEDVDYIEAHGTGTGVGDPVELNALGAVFGRDRPAQRPLLVGSVKTNIGHTEAAAGIAGLIKTVLCLEHGMVPPSLHSGELTSAVDWENLPLRVPQEPLELRDSREPRDLPGDDWPVVAGVSSFGISGTNVHVVVGQHRPAARPAEDERPPEDEREHRPRLLALSSHDPGALRDLAESYARYLEPGGDGAGESLRDICFSAATRRQAQDNRLTLAGQTHEELAGKLRSFVAGEPAQFLRAADDVYPRRSQIVFVFPGQGSQWVGMGRDLAEKNEAFRDALHECDAAVRAETGWSVAGRLAGDAALEGADVIQPTLWAVEVALAAAWRAAGIEPDVVVGHSMGEIAAACVAGALSVADAAAVICRRSALAMKVSGRGAMASVDLSADEVTEALKDYAGLVSVAAVNGPSSTVLSGDAQAMRGLLASFTERGIFCRLVQVDFASHSPQMEPLTEPLRSELQSVSPRPAEIPMYSTVLEEPVTGQSLDAGYWVRNLREPVRFGPVIEQLAKNGPATFIEISPHPILVPAMREYADKAGDATVVGSTRRNEPEAASLLDSVAAVWLSGHPVDLGCLFEDGSAYVRLPAQAWRRQKHWLPGTAHRPQAAQSSRAAPAHPLLGAKVPGDGHVWEGPLDLSVNAYLHDHQVQGVPIVPGTAYLEMAAAAAASVFGSVPEMRDVTYREAIFLTGSLPPVIRVAIERDGEPGSWRFTISSRPGDQPEFTLNADGRFEHGDTSPGDAGTARPDKDKDNINNTENINGEEFYRRFEAKGNQWRGAFRGVRQLRLGQTGAVAQVEAPEAIAGQIESHHFHPALLDACGHVLAAVTGDDTASSQHDAFVLGSIDRVRLHRPPRGPVRAYATRTDSRPEYVAGDVEVRDEAGTLLAEMRGVRLRFLIPREKRSDAGEWIHAVQWRRAALTGAPGPAPAGCWVLFADDGGTAEAVARRLDGRVILVTRGSSYARAGADRYELPPDEADSYRALLADLHRELGGDTSVGVVHLWSLDGADDEAVAPAVTLGCRSVLHLAQALDGADWSRDLRLWLVTAGGQYLPGRDERVCPGQALLWGFGRALAQEYREWRCTLIDLPPGTAGPHADLLSAELLSGGDGENQVALRDGRYAARLVRDASVPGAGQTGPDRPGSSDGPGGAPARVEVRSRAVGSLDGIGLSAAESRKPGRGEVGIQVDGAALNYRDVLMAMGAYPGQSDHPVLGWECAGTVADTGEGVAGLRRGDKVVAVAEGALASYVVAKARLVAPVPAGLTAEEALTVPAAYLTAYYGLCELANLTAGERVLIHSATGGVGLAALHIARWRGAEVYATAGSPQKRAFLKTLGVKHVADSRSLDFAASVLEATRGEGVDVVLNSLAGEAIGANLSLLAPYGRYVELSKKDLLEDRSIGLLPFSKNLSLHSVDLVDLFQTRPGQAGELLNRVFGLLEAGLIQPLPYETYDVAEASEAFRHMARSRHIGKVLVRFPSRTGPRETASPRTAPLPVPAPREWNASGGTCLITGGLGGIGLALAAWLAGRGARDLLLVGRRPLEDQPAPQREALRDLDRAGVTVTYRAADVTDERAMSAVVAEHENGGHPPVTGVMHAAGVLDLAPVAELSPGQLDAMIRPKLDGAWTLHRVLGNRPLDFFVLFSSASAVLGSPQLAAYAAANAALDAFAAWRRSRGLPALSVNWGFWSSVGMVARYTEQHGRNLAPKGMGTFTPQEGTEVLQRLLGSGAQQAVVLPADWNRWAQAYPDAAREPLLRDLLAGSRLPEPPEPPEPPVAEESPGGADPDALREFLTRLTAKVLGLPPDRLSARKPLNRQGLDSLMATEIRSEIHREYGLTVPMAKMIGGQSLAELADYVAREAEKARGLSQRVGPHVLEDQGRLGVGDVRVRAQRLHEQAQVVAGGGRDVQQEVVLPGQEEDVQHLGQARHAPHEGPDVPARARLQPDRDHGLQRAAERRRVHVRVVAADDALLAQRAHPAQAGRRRDADPLGQRVIGEPGVGRQLPDDRPVGFIQVTGPNRLRRGPPRDGR